jgi:hypothetical protein
VAEFSIGDSPSIGGARVSASGVAVLPYARADLNETKQILVHFQVAELNALLRLELAQAINEALKSVRVHGHSIVPVITDAAVTMTAIDVQIIAAQIAPTVARALGVTLPT